MVPCVVMGDSIAIGVAMFRPDCQVIAKTGISSQHYVGTLLRPENAEVVVISLGVNDDPRAPTLENLRKLRASTHGQTVYWLLPGIHDHARAAIAEVARQYGDQLIDTRPHVGPDHLHPTGAGYKYLARLTGGAQKPRAEPIPLGRRAASAYHASP